MEVFVWTCSCWLPYIPHFPAALLDTFLSMAMKRVKKSVLFVPEPYESKPLLDRLRELLGSRDESSYFYLAHLDYDDPNTLVWNMVITLQGQPDVIKNKRIMSLKNDTVDKIHGMIYFWIQIGFLFPNQAHLWLQFMNNLEEIENLTAASFIA